MSDVKQPRQQVAIDKEVWEKMLNPLLGNLAYNTVAPIVNALQQTGGVVDIPLPVTVADVPTPV